MPSEHLAQLQGQLLVSGREWVDFVSYWPGLPIFIKRVHRDPEYLARLTEALDAFEAELSALVNRFSTMKEAA